MQTGSQKTPKSPEVARFMELKKENKLTWEQFSDEIGVPKRTLQHYCWETGVLSGVALRAAHDKFGVSLDWLLTGSGTMYQGTAQPAPEQPEKPKPAQVKEPISAYQNGQTPAQALFPFLETIDMGQIQDFFYVTAAAIEQSLMEAGDRPGIDYTRLDIYRLALPIVTEEFKKNGLEINIFERGGAGT
jgi:hypothetical protein